MKNLKTTMEQFEMVKNYEFTQFLWSQMNIQTLKEVVEYGVANAAVAPFIYNSDAYFLAWYYSTTIDQTIEAAYGYFPSSESFEDCLINSLWTAVEIVAHELLDCVEIIVEDIIDCLDSYGVDTNEIDDLQTEIEELIETYIEPYDLPAQACYMYDHTRQWREKIKTEMIDRYYEEEEEE